MDDIIIDLKNSARGRENIELSWDISVEDGDSGFLRKLPFVRNHMRLERKVYLHVDHLQIDGLLDCDKKRLLSFFCEGIEYGQEQMPVEVMLTGTQNLFQLYINKDAIKDCRERQNRDERKYSIAFDVVVSDEKKKVISKQPVRLNVKFVRLDVRPSVEIDLEEDVWLYSEQKGEEVRIGQMSAWIEEDYSFTPHLTFQTGIRLFANGQPCDEKVVYFKERGVRVSHVESDLKPSREEIRHFDIFLDFSRIANPVEMRQEYVLERSTTYWMEYSPEIKQPLPSQSDKFFVEKDQQGTELRVAVSTADGQQYIETDHTFTQPLFSFVPHSRMQSQVEVSLINLATDSSNPRAGLFIRNLMLTDTVKGEIRVLDEEDNPLESFIRLETVNEEDLIKMKNGQGFFLQNGREASIALSLLFDPSRISRLTDMANEFEVHSLLVFDYCENKDGLPPSRCQFKTFKLPVEWHLRVEPYPEWLCVDYGSSAIVCHYGGKLINLNTQKKALFNTDPHYGDFLGDTWEKNTPFLSSDVMFHTTDDRQQESSLCSEQKVKNDYSTLAVCLSPTSSLVSSAPANQLPCLKILVGNEFIPKNPFYEAFRYPKSDPKTGNVRRVTNKDTMKDANSLMRVSNIFKESYNELFRYFISSMAGDKKRINKLVLTYPNTYTPVHLKVLKGIVGETFPYLRKDFLRFVSESDAVAAYYIANWSRMNDGQRGVRDASERVLVYDMGAGTLDVTLFDKKLNETGGIDVEVIGKLGTGKAGNYLDFILARIISQYLNLDSLYRAEIASTTFVPNETVRKGQNDLKDFIRQTVKPQLVSGATFTYNKKQLEADAIIQHAEFQQFLTDVTTEMIAQLRKYMEMKKLRVDTVILSGRSCRLQLLQKALTAAFEAENEDPRYISFDKKDTDKTLVVEGAMAQASLFDREQSEVKVQSKRLYASYGVVYQVIGGRYRYVELLNHIKDIPSGDNVGTFQGPSVTITGTAASQSIRLIQTYMSAGETEVAYNDGKKEFIAEMEEYDMANFGNANQLNVRLQVDKDNNLSLYVNGNRGKGTAPKGVDLTSEITKRSIWPVTVTF